MSGRIGQDGGVRTVEEHQAAVAGLLSRLPVEEVPLGAAHGRVLVELGLEPLLDLRLRLGEGSGAALAFPLVGLAARLHAEMRTFDQARVDA